MAHGFLCGIEKYLIFDIFWLHKLNKCLILNFKEGILQGNEKSIYNAICFIFRYTMGA